MLKTLLALVVAGATAMPAVAFAKTFKLGGATPVASITLPDTWRGEQADGGLETLSPDKAIYLSAEIVASADLKTQGQDLARTLKEQKIVLKQETRKVAAVTVSGMPGASIDWEASDAEGATQVHIIVLKAKPGEQVLLMRWGDAEAEKAHAGEIDGIVKSLAPEK